MVAIHHLPRELLAVIFEDFKSCDLIQAQKVCRTWYLPVHLLLLKNVNLHSAKNIETFITSIDQNTNPSYLDAVEKIDIKSNSERWSSVEYGFNKENIEKLFCRFPNLAYVSIDSHSSCFKEVNRELCKVILQNCPKLNHFEVHLNSKEDKAHAVYCGTLYKLRSLVTTMKLDSVDTAPAYAGVVKFVGRFPRLKEVYGIYHQLNDFKIYLPIFERLRNLRAIHVQKGYGDDQDNFAEKYLASKTNEQQKMLVQRLSKVTDVTYSSYDYPFCPNSVKFIAKYFTGLERLNIRSNFMHRPFTTSHQEVLFGVLSSLMVNDNADVTLKNIHLPMLANFLPTLVHKIFSQLPYKNTVLRIDMQNIYSPLEVAELRMLWPTTPNITVTIPKDRSFDDIISTLFNSQLGHIDQLSFSIGCRKGNAPEMNINNFNKLLKAMPSIKQAAFDIPMSFNDRISSVDHYHHTGVETLTLRATSAANFPSLLSAYAITFPNLKNLNIFYNFAGVDIRSGVNKDREVVINLENYKLERLTIDLTLLKWFRHTCTSDFYVLQVDSLEGTERYKVSIDLSSITRYNEESRQSYFCYHIIINSLQCLVGYILSNSGVESLSRYDYWSIADREEYLNNLNGKGLKRVIIFNKN